MSFSKYYTLNFYYPVYYLDMFLIFSTVALEHISLTFEVSSDSELVQVVFTNSIFLFPGQKVVISKIGSQSLVHASLVDVELEAV